MPGLQELLGRPVADPPKLDAQATQMRPFSTVEGVLARQQQALLILVEDVHGADQESLLLLKRLAGQLSERPIM